MIFIRPPPALCGGIPLARRRPPAGNLQGRAISPADRPAPPQAPPAGVNARPAFCPAALSFAPRKSDLAFQKIMPPRRKGRSHALRLQKRAKRTLSAKDRACPGTCAQNELSGRPRQGRPQRPGRRVRPLHPAAVRRGLHPENEPQGRACHRRLFRLHRPAAGGLLVAAGAGRGGLCQQGRVPFSVAASPAGLCDQGRL